MKLKIPRDNGSRCQRFPKVSCLCFFFRRCAKLAATLKKKNTRWRRFHTPLCCSVIIFRLTHRRKNTEKRQMSLLRFGGWGRIYTRSFEEYDEEQDYLHLEDLKNLMISSAKLLARQRIEAILSPKQQRRPLPSLL